jgi:hypothetical protein
MALLVMYAVQNAKYPVYDGSHLFKKAWVTKGKVKKKDAALLAGVMEDKLSKEDAKAIMRCMNDVKTGFAGWMNTHVTTWWVQNAKDIGLVNHLTNCPVVIFSDVRVG